VGSPVDELLAKFLFIWVNLCSLLFYPLMIPDPYLFIVIFVGVAATFPLLPLALAWLWRHFFQPPKPGVRKNATYECGIESLGEAHIQFSSQYYVYCIIFLIFDVEAVFLVPFAVAFTGLPVGAFLAILVFLLLLIEGLVWAWSKGCLEWARVRPQ
jgi:NADH-quinone oxidoreductase subunit A